MNLIPRKFLLISALCSAAVAFTEPEGTPETITLRFLVLEEAGGRYLLQTETGRHHLSSYPYAISPPVRVVRGERATVFKTLPPDPNEGEEAQPRQIPVAVIRPPASANDALVVLRPAAPGASYHVRYHNSAAEVFPAATLRVINLANETIGIELAGRIKQIEPGETAVMEGRPDHRNRVIARIARRGPEEWHILYNSVLVMRPGERMTGVVVFSPSGMRHTYTEDELIEFGNPPPRHEWLTYTEKL